MKTRIISAIIAAIIVVPFILIGKMPFVIGCMLLATMGYKELIDLKKSHNKIPLPIVIIGLISMLLLVLTNVNSIFKLANILPFQLVSYLILLFSCIFCNEDDFQTKDIFYLLGTTLFLGLFFNKLAILRLDSIWQLLFVIFIPMFTDSFALFGGMLFGKHKMAPKISPKKTWEGAVSGLLFGSLAGIIIYSNFIGDFSLKLLLVCIILSIVGQLGDLFFSKIKRENDIKDFSNLMPGHGGVLDRIDSVAFTTLMYAALMTIL